MKWNKSVLHFPVVIELYVFLLHFWVEWWWWWWWFCLLFCDILCVWYLVCGMNLFWLSHDYQNNSPLIRQIWEWCFLIHSSCLAELFQTNWFLGLIKSFAWFLSSVLPHPRVWVSLLWSNRRPLTPEGRSWWGTKWLTLVGGSSPREWWISESWTNRPRSSTTSSKIPAHSPVYTDFEGCAVTAIPLKLQKKSTSSLF